MWNDLIKTGTRDSYSSDLNYKIILANNIALITTLTSIVYAVFSYYYAPALLFLCILSAVLSLLTLILNASGEYNVSRVYISIFGVVVWNIFHGLITPQGGEVISHFYLQALVSLTIPFLLFDLEEPSNLYGVVIFIIIQLILFPYTNYWLADFSLDASPNEIPWQATSYLMVILFAVTMFFLLSKKHHYLQEKNQSLIKNTEEKNKALETSQKELQSTLVEVEKNRQEEEKRAWASKGFAKFGDLLRTYQNMDMVYDKLIAELIQYLGAHQGAVYLVEENEYTEEIYLEMKGCFAHGRKKFIQDKIQIIGEELLGQCYLEKAYIYIEEVPVDFLKIRSGLGEAQPSALLLVPLKMEDIVEGVIELAAFKKFKKYEIEFLEKLGEAVASTISSIKINEQTRALLKESQEYTERLQAQEEEMRQNMEELQATQEAMHDKQQELEEANKKMAANEGILKKSYEKMRVKEKEILEKNEVLKHNEEILKQNMEELSIAQVEMEQKQRALEAANKKMAANEHILKKAYDKISENELLIKQKNQDLLENQTELKQSMEELAANREVLQSQKEALENTYSELQNKTNTLTSSIIYAERIQQAILPDKELLLEYFTDSFIIFRPKDIVSGDFYWMTVVERQIFIAVVDCTGHGVPGAFMSMIGSAFLNNIVAEKRILEPHLILENLHYQIRKALRQESGGNNDGMDLGLMSLQKNKDTSYHLKFAGAKSSMYYIAEDEIQELKGDRKAIGGYQSENHRTFTCLEATLHKGDSIYLFSDGYIDTPDYRRKRFGTKKLKEILYKNFKKPMLQQEEVLNQALDEHQGNNAQRDDTTLLGLKI